MPKSSPPDYQGNFSLLFIDRLKLSAYDHTQNSLPSLNVFPLLLSAYQALASAKPVQRPIQKSAAANEKFLFAITASSLGEIFPEEGKLEPMFCKSLSSGRICIHHLGLQVQATPITLSCSMRAKQTKHLSAVRQLPSLHLPTPV